MSAELQVDFPGDQDAERAVAALSKLLQVLSDADRLNEEPRRPGNRGWRFSHLGLGSVQAAIAPAAAQDGLADRTFNTIVRGLAEAEEHVGVPTGWDASLTRSARDLIAAAPHGMTLRVVTDGAVRSQAHVTATAKRNLDAGLSRGHRDSIGSLIGQLDSVTLHDRREARLWPERGGPAVPIRFDADQTDLIKDHLGARVEAAGRLRRDAFGQVLHLRLKTLDRLPDFADSPPLASLLGLDPNFTAGKTADEYLRELRGQAQ